MAGKARENGEGSIFPYKNGFAAYVWITTPSGKHVQHALARTPDSGEADEADLGHSLAVTAAET